jgi:hypothetical protein
MLVRLLHPPLLSIVAEAAAPTTARPKDVSPSRVEATGLSSGAPDSASRKRKRVEKDAAGVTSADAPGPSPRPAAPQSRAAGVLSPAARVPAAVAANAMIDDASDDDVTAAVRRPSGGAPKPVPVESAEDSDDGLRLSDLKSSRSAQAPAVGAASLKPAPAAAAAASSQAARAPSVDVVKPKPAATRIAVNAEDFFGATSKAPAQPAPQTSGAVAVKDAAAAAPPKPPLRSPTKQERAAPVKPAPAITIVDDEDEVGGSSGSSCGPFKV